MQVQSFYSDITCGDNCWHAKDEVCHCSCGGKNHGILNKDGEQPVRTAKINGSRYELMAVGGENEIRSQAWELLKVLPPKSEAYGYRYGWDLTDVGSPYRVKGATFDQIQKWTELQGYRHLTKENWYFYRPALLWKKVD